MANTLGWARVTPLIQRSERLRRGAWYRVIDDAASTQNVVLDVDMDGAPRPVKVPRTRLRIRRHRPERLSVVELSSNDPNPARGTSGFLGSIYAVCPKTGSRLRLWGRPDRVVCSSCREIHSVAWDDRC